MDSGVRFSRSMVRQDGGFSLSESMMVVAVLAVLAITAMPAMLDLVGHSRGRGAADLLRGDLQFARSEAISRRVHVYLLFSRGTQWCYAVSTDPACGCIGVCGNPDSVIKVVQSTDFKNVSVPSASFAGTFCGATECVRFEPMRGTAVGSVGTVVFQNDSGARYKVIVSTLGRVRTCRDSGDSGAGLPSC